MCIPASFRVLQDRVLYSRLGDSHEHIVEEHHLRVTAPDDYDVLGVPVEFVPPAGGYTLPVDRWELLLSATINRITLPSWYSDARARQQCLDAMPDWWADHVVEDGEHLCGPERSLLVISGSPQIIVVGGLLCVCASAAPQITLCEGRVFTLDKSQPSTTQTGGEMFTCGESRPKIVQSGGLVFTLDHSRPQIVKSGGEVHSYGKSQPVVTRGIIQ